MNISNKNIHPSQIDNSNDYPKGYSVSEKTKSYARHLTSSELQSSFNSMTRESPPVRKAPEVRTRS